ncbi:ATP12 family protein [Paracoccus sp. 1_MG-2023]|uniref:ATP12 family chaperone protein n=1 Tax=unclassified Paracoccus (in: a-proteobacteria) TaxID=2688777 RepID=UPI001C095301|nr:MULTISPECIES: ATP12 family protein [unclassified Paracoccus (in: a-proteobacteria)]MBU2957429.1 ATPase [Paracoccus sp. C2R09]MDO6669627.1 ATP12 family protein [Paracoccus sp. 1_MG-2023]
MSEWKARRFWKAAGIRETGEGWEVALDDRPLRTPGKQALILPTEDLALAVAAEWDAQEDEIRPQSMPLTRAANSAIEKVTPQFAGVASMLAEYAGTDLLSYRAGDPRELVELQAQGWDPIIDWAATRFDARLVVTTGVIPVAQDPVALARLARATAALDVFGLTALHDLVTLPGSLLLGLAVIEGRIDAAEAHALSRIDEEYQIRQWGEDEEAREAADGRLLAMQDAERLWGLSRRD